MSEKAEAERQTRVLMRGVVDCVTREDLTSRIEKSLKEGRPLRAKLGVDPTAPDIHLGHAVVLRKLKQFQDLGHQAVLIIGSGTAMVGDPTGKDKTRPQLTEEDVRRNAETYMAQAGRVIDLSKTEVVDNATWFKAMGFFDIIRLVSRMTVARMLERDLFEKRYREGAPISLHEFIYPLMQGWDSVEVRSDIEIGGSDQLFNLLIGRDLMRDESMEPQLCMTTPLIEGLDGTHKMSKSLGNYIGVEFEPNDMYGKLMSIPDSLMEKYFLLLTCLEELEIAELLSEKIHPKQAKKRLAREITTDFHSEEAAIQAGEEFERVFAQKELPESIPEVSIDFAEFDDDGHIGVIRILVSLEFAKSNSEARRLIKQGGVKLGGERCQDPETRLALKEPILVQAGKRRFATVSCSR